MTAPTIRQMLVDPRTNFWYGIVSIQVIFLVLWGGGYIALAGSPAGLSYYVIQSMPGGVVTDNAITTALGIGLALSMKTRWPAVLCFVIGCWCAAQKVFFFLGFLAAGGWGGPVLWFVAGLTAMWCHRGAPNDWLIQVGKRNLRRSTPGPARHPNGPQVASRVARTGTGAA